MSYSVFVHRFTAGSPSPAPYAEVAAVLRKYGTVGKAGDRLEFTPDGDDICEVGFIGGDEDSGIGSVMFERPCCDGRLTLLVFDLLGIPGMCYFEQDVVHVYARSDITGDMPEGLLEESSTGLVTVISSASELEL